MIYEIDGCLVHHGIKGQKWGDRNGPPYPLKASVAKRVKIRSKFYKKDSDDTRRNIKEADSVQKKISAAVGTKRMSTKMKNSSEMHAKLAEQSKTRLGKHLHSVKSYNDAQMAKYYDDAYERIQKDKNWSDGSKIFFDFIATSKSAGYGLDTVPMKTWSGRETTRSKEKASALISTMLGSQVSSPIMQDIDYILKKKL